jgi:hypothetical protein
LVAAIEARADVVAAVAIIYIADVVFVWLVLELLARSALFLFYMWGEVTTKKR